MKYYDCELLLDFMISWNMIQNVGPHFEMWNAGILGPVNLNGLDEGRRDLTWQKWTYKVRTKFFDTVLELFDVPASPCLTFSIFAHCQLDWFGWRSNESSFPQWKFICRMDSGISRCSKATTDMV